MTTTGAKNIMNSAFWRFLAGLLLCFVVMQSQAQVVIMPVSGHGDTTMSYAELYDDGGASLPHSQQCNATYTFHTVNPQGRYIIEVENYLTHPQGNALLQISDGPSLLGMSICTFPNSFGTLFYSTMNSVTIGFVSDDDNPTDGFKVTLCEYINAVASVTQADFLDSNTYFIRWGGGYPGTVWTVDYAIVDTYQDLSTFFDDSSNYTTIQLDTGYLEIHGIAVGQRVVYRIWTPQGDAPCMMDVTMQGEPYRIVVPCPCIRPDDIQVESLEDSLHVTWSYSGTSANWHIWYPTLFMDTVLNGNVMEFTIPYDYPCFGDFMMINGDCDTNCNPFTFNLPTGGCHLSPGSLSCTATTGSTISLQWGNVGDTNARLLLYYRRANSGAEYTLLDTLPPSMTSLTIEGLSPVTRYDFMMTVICPDGSLSCNSVMASFSTTLDNCIDFVNINDHEKVHLTWGVYSDPMRNTSGSGGRHVPIVDTTVFDHNTGYLLRQVPPGDRASFRLGDENVGGLAETVTYDYDVDSLDKDMLVLKYAIVLQNSNHNSVNQPHFTMEILDQNGDVIDQNCCYADFYAAGDLGWNSVEGTNIIWKDWTTVGIDIAPYHGQRIKIRFTTKDCSDGGHFGYAYFTISCDSKRIALVNLCETHDSVRLRVPLGFEYSWTHDNDTMVISTENEIFVAADSTTYHCHASFVGNPSCSFDVHSVAVLPKAKADVEVHFDTCANQVTLSGKCRVDIDSSLMPYVRQTIDSVWWVIEGVAYPGDTAVVTVSQNGPLNGTVFCSLSDSYCVDSLVFSVDVDIYHGSRIVGDTVSCYGDTVLLTGSVWPGGDVALAWDDNSRDSIRAVVVTSDTMLTLLVNYLSCFDTLFHSISVKQHYDDTVSADFCVGQCDTLGFTEQVSGLYTHRLTSIYGCDSLITLNLTIHPDYYDTTRVASCDKPYSDGEFSEDSSGVYTHYYQTVWGCDSLYLLEFVRHPLFTDTIVEEILYGDTYVGYGFRERETGFYEKVYADRNGCDSTYRLDLTTVTLRFPNAVTPNGDGYNDILEIVGLLEATLFDYNCIWVYDRWGKLVYRKENIASKDDFWNPAKTRTPDGTYFYRFYARSISHEIEHKGAVEVLSH